MTEDYITPVGPAREPAAERRRWIGRFFLAVFVGIIAWLLWYRVITPSDESGPVPIESELPGPI